LKPLGFTIRRSAASLLLYCMRLRNYIFGLFDKRRRFYAEFFIDRYIRRNFFPDFSYRGCVVEVGCATPELLSMSQHFREFGWRCIGIEPNPSFVALHKARGNEVYQYAAADFEADDYDFVVAEAQSNYSDRQLSAHSYSSLSIKPEYLTYKGGAFRNFKQSKIKVRVRRLDDILSAHCASMPNIDLLAIDVEGYELEVMKGFTPAQYETKVIVLENLFHNPAYTEYMKSIGYRLQKNIKYNYIYVSDSVGSGA
jgi:FkbM family methyltransferase